MMTNAEVIRDDIIMADRWSMRCDDCEDQYVRIVIIAIQADVGCEAFKIQARQCTDCGSIFTTHTKVSA
jgi:hypothetical protein